MSSIREYMMAAKEVAGEFERPEKWLDLDGMVRTCMEMPICPSHFVFNPENGVTAFAAGYPVRVVAHKGDEKSHKSIVDAVYGATNRLPS